MNLVDGYSAICQAIAAAFAAPESLTPSEWADRERVLPSKGAAEPGRWRTDRTPYLREPLDAMGARHPATDIVFQAASQVGKSELVNNAIGYIIDQAPAPVLMVQPTEGMAERYSKQRLAPMIDATPALRSKVAPARSRDQSNTALLKEFTGGILVLAGANSPSGLASMPAKFVLQDEIDRYPETVGDEGDPTIIADQRSVTFVRGKRLKTSTPTRVGKADADGVVRGGSRIHREYESSSRAQYWVPCPHCGEKQVLDFKRGLRWDKTVDEAGRTQHLPETAAYWCEHCGARIEERHKTRMLLAGEWRHRNPERRKLGYQISALYAPLGLGYTWPDIAARWIEAKRDPAKLQPFFNLILGEAFEDHAERLRGSAIEGRAEAWPVRTVPEGILVLTLGVDVQADRLELHLVGWGEYERSAVLDYVVIDGDPARPEGMHGSPWTELTRYRQARVRNGFGFDLPVSMTAIDSGYLTHAVYGYVRAHRAEHVIATKGADGKRPLLGKPSRQDVKNDRGDMVKHGVNVWIVGADTAKDAFFARLDGDLDIEADRAAERMVRFPAGLPREYYEQLVAEVYDTVKGRYVQLRARNEALDTYLLAMAAAQHPRVRVHRLQAADWAHLRSIVEPRDGSLFEQTAAEKGGAAVAPSDVPAGGTPPAGSSIAPVQAPAADAEPGWLPAAQDWLH